MSVPMLAHFYVGYNVRDEVWCVFMTGREYKVYSRWSTEISAQNDAVRRTQNLQGMVMPETKKPPRMRRWRV